MDIDSSPPKPSRPTQPAAPCQTCGPGWQFPLLLALVLVAILLFRAWNHHPQETTGPAAPPEIASRGHQANHTPPATTTQAVRLDIDFGNGERMEFTAPWRDGMRVADALRNTPGLQLSQRGSGAGTFLDAINSTANQGENGSNWTYQVNGKQADRSFEIQELRPGDRVLWTFGPPR